MDASAEGRVVSLHLSAVQKEPLTEVENATFVANFGIEGDHHATSKEERQGYQVLLVGEDTLKAVGVSPGEIRENVTTAGVDIDSLEAGQQVALGQKVLLSISKACEPCSRMDELRQGLRQELDGRRGMLAGVVRGGVVKTGDRVAVV